MSFYNDPEVSIRAQWTRIHHVNKIQSTYRMMVPDTPGNTADGKLHGILPPDLDLGEGPRLKNDDRMDELAPPPSPKLGGQPPKFSGAPPKVAIIGAGAAGLFTAMILDYLKEKVPNFEVDYDILEASDRVGGRLFTYQFNGCDQAHPFYYDVGAMRFPQNDIMKRTFDLFKQLNMTIQPLAKDNSTPLGAIVPYYMTNLDSAGNKAEYWCYNDTSLFGDYSKLQQAASSGDPFNINVNGDIDVNVLQNPESALEAAISDFRTALKTGAWMDAWSLLMSYDACSTRAYLEGNFTPPSGNPSPPPNYNFDTVEYLETFNAGTGWYDQALSEAVLESLDFDYDPTANPPIPWYCIYGGTLQLATNMKNSLSNQSAVQTGQRVSRIDTLGAMNMNVYTNGGSTATNYASVFASTTLGCLKMIDTSRAGLNYAVKQAMRCLDYGPSAKVGIMFNDPWWRNLSSNPIKSGGLGHSDLMIRTCVYPSYNLNPDNGNYVLLVSYTWQQDALHIGSLMSSTVEPNALTHEQVQADEAKLLDLIYWDLARMHSADGQDVEKLYSTISGAYVDHYSHDWTHDPNTAGAFAFFGPQQFPNLWPDIVRPSNDLVIIGEAATPNHAWVVGALESAVVGVYQWLSKNSSSINGVLGKGGALDVLENGAESGDETPFWGLPAYMPANNAKWNSLLSALQSEALERKVQGKA